MDKEDQATSLALAFYKEPNYTGRMPPQHVILDSVLAF